MNILNYFLFILTINNICFCLCQTTQWHSCEIVCRCVHVYSLCSVHVQVLHYICSHACLNFCPGELAKCQNFMHFFLRDELFPEKEAQR